MASSRKPSPPERALFRETFRAASQSFYAASRLFPARVRADVEVLYALVRTADSCVDEHPQQPARLGALEAGLLGTGEVATPDESLVSAARELTERCGIDPAWWRAFFAAMRSDLSPQPCATLEDTLRYTYGSAEVIGLMLNRILAAPAEADAPAELLGRAFQYINFIRDLGEDLALGRQYLPLAHLRAHGLDDCTPASAARSPAAFAAWIGAELGRYRAWQEAALPGVALLPLPVRPALYAACARYSATADRIARDPVSVYRAHKHVRYRDLARASLHLLLQ